MSFLQAYIWGRGGLPVYKGKDGEGVVIAAELKREDPQTYQKLLIKTKTGGEESVEDRFKGYVILKELVREGDVFDTETLQGNREDIE